MNGVKDIVATKIRCRDEERASVQMTTALPDSKETACVCGRDGESRIEKKVQDRTTGNDSGASTSQCH